MSDGTPTRFAGASTLVGQAGRFGVVGAATYLLDVAVYNYLVFGVLGGAGPLADHPLVAKTISVSLAAAVTWLGNRVWTFRHGRRRRLSHEIPVFVLVNVGGLLIAVGTLGVSRHILGFDSQLADNISANVVGFALASAFRFWGYRRLVFRAA